MSINVCCYYTFYKNKLYKNNEAEISKKIRTN